MSKESKGSSGAPQDTSGVEAESKANAEQHSVEQDRRDAVAYETYRKVLGEKKRLDEKSALMEAELATLRDEKLSAEGKTAELLDSTRKKLAETENKFKKTVGSFAMRAVSLAIEREALKAGCVDVDGLIRLSDLSDIEVDDDFSVSEDQVKELVEKQRKARAYLFSTSKQGPKVGAGVMNHNAQPDWKSLPLSEQAKLYFTKK